MSSLYLHTQPGWTIRYLVGGMIIVWIIILIVNPQKNWKPTLFIGLPVTLTMLSLLWNMTIEVTKTHVHHSFNFGFWKRSVPLENIKTVTKSTSNWYNGYGIRYVGTGWLYQVSGSDIILFQCEDGSEVWLGTDDQETLFTILSEQIKQ